MFGIKGIKDDICSCIKHINRVKDAIGYKELDCGLSFSGERVVIGSSKEIKEIKMMLYCLMDYLDVSYIPRSDISLPARIVENKKQKGKK